MVLSKQSVLGGLSGITRRITLTTNPSYSTSTGSWLVNGLDADKQQWQIDLTVLPPGVTKDLIKAGQQWFVERTTTYNRLSYYVGEFNIKISSDPGYHGRFYSTTNQTTTANTPRLINFNATENNFGFHLANITSGTEIVVENTGLYYIHFRLQVSSTSASTQVVNSWYRLNGVDLPYSANEYTLSGNGLALISRNEMLDLTTNDILQIVWASNNSNVSLTTQPSQTVPFTMPGIPSMAVSIFQL